MMDIHIQKPGVKHTSTACRAQSGSGEVGQTLTSTFVLIAALEVLALNQALYLDLDRLGLGREFVTAGADAAKQVSQRQL